MSVKLSGFCITLTFKRYNTFDIKILSMFCVFEMIFRNHVHLNCCGLLSVTAQWQVTLSYD